MAHRKFLILFAIALMVGGASAAMAQGVPDLENSWVEMPCCIIDPGVIFNLPNGGGNDFDEVRTLEDGVVDATITLYLRDAFGDPVFNYPAEDVWLSADAPGSFHPCPSGTIADGDTDANGITQWVNPLRAGGWSEGPTVVMISGNPLLSGDLNMGHNSPDITGDLVVNLLDVSTFAGDFYGSYTFRSDLFYDGVHNLSDVAKLAQALGASCP
jgi:hypothetical protein